MLANFKKHIELKFPFLKESKLLVTVSGGIDSVVLLHLLYQLDYSIVITHCNFCLREKESDIDEVFVKNLASKLEVPFFTKRFSTEKYASNHKLSIQEAARNLRYQWFSTLAKEQKCHAILTAHNLNDNLETFLINFSRGTGLKGLIGIPQINKNINRPLMAFSRKEITAFANENNIEWREDKSNANTKYTRNKIRHSIIPVLEELNPNLLVSFKQTLENLQGSQQIVESQILDFKQQIEVENPSVSLNSEENTKKFNVKKFKNLKNPKAYIHAIFAPYNFTNFNDIVGLLSAQSGKQLFSKTHR
ncbi:MAG: tRNA lysidine(34) synthetase TilS, partial [Flavobacteriaceae bacterium]